MEKYRESIELAERITRYLEGKLSDMEELELEKELQGIPEGEKLLERIRDPKAIVAKKEIYKSFDAKRSWNEIHQHQENNKQMFQLLPEKSICFPFLSLHRVHGNCHFLSNLFLGETQHTQLDNSPSFLG